MKTQVLETKRPSKSLQQRSKNAVGGSVRLKKAVDTLAIVPSNQRITLLARKVYNVLLYYAQKQGIDQPIYRASLRDVARGIEFNSNNTEVLKEHLRQMVTTKVEWQSPTASEGQRWSVSAMISHADLTFENSEVVIEWSYAPNIRAELLDPQRFAMLSIQFMSSLRSYASVALYEICCRYINNPSGLTARQHWEWWHPVLTGALPDEIAGIREYKYFKRDVLRNAITEINALTDVRVELIERKAGRAVADIQFRVGRPPQSSLPLSTPPEPVDLRHIAKAISLGIPQEKSERLFAKYGAAIFTEALQTLETRSAQTRLAPIADSARFLAALLTSIELKKKDTQPNVQSSNASTARGNTKATKIALIERFRNNRRAEIGKMFGELDATKQKESVELFEKQIVPSLHPAIVRAYKRDGVMSTLTRPLFLKFVADQAWGNEWDQPTDTELLELATSDQ
jgi:hypothetical protein